MAANSYVETLQRKPEYIEDLEKVSLILCFIPEMKMNF